MALTITPEIQGQEPSFLPTYCYLYEPLRVFIEESDSSPNNKLYIDLEVRSDKNVAIVLATIPSYVTLDINPSEGNSIDLMNIVRQHLNLNLYNFSHIDELTSGLDNRFGTIDENCDVKIYNQNTSGEIQYLTGESSVVGEYLYVFWIRSTASPSPVSIRKIVIIGGRDFENFTPVVDRDQPLTEADLYNINLEGRWKAYPLIENILSNPSDRNFEPSIIKSISGEGRKVEGYIVYKSRLGGWMTWGFDIKTKNNKKKYIGNLKSGMFESTKSSNGQPYVPPNYTGVEYSYTLTLKALGLTHDELMAVRGIEFSPAVYFMKDSKGSLELMRVSSVSAPTSSLGEGGDFSVTLQSISSTSHKTR